MNNPDESHYQPGQPYPLPTQSAPTGGPTTPIPPPDPAGASGSQSGAPAAAPFGAPNTQAGSRGFWAGQPTAILVTGGLALCGLIAVAVWALLSSRPSTDAVTPTSSDVYLESTNNPGSNPFTPPVGEDHTGLSRVSTGGDVSGGTPAVYGAIGEKPSCDAPTLLSYLEADPAKAGAWAQSLDIAASDIPSFVQTLSPVLLRADTSVIVHGYLDGKFVPYPAILQSGTAVFVNSYGEPTVKCFSGDPLTKGVAVTQATFVGHRWTGFGPATVIVIQPTQAPVDQRVVLNIVTNQTVVRRVVRDTRHGPNPDHRNDRNVTHRRDKERDKEKEHGRDKEKEHESGTGDNNKVGGPDSGSPSTSDPDSSNNTGESRKNVGPTDTSSPPAKPEPSTNNNSTSEPHSSNSGENPESSTKAPGPTGPTTEKNSSGEGSSGEGSGGENSSGEGSSGEN